MEQEIVCIKSHILVERGFISDITTNNTEVSAITQYCADTSYITTELLLNSDTQVTKGENCGS